MSRTVLHGLNQSGPTADRPSNASEGFVFYDETTKELLAFDETDDRFYGHLKSAQFEYNFADDGGLVSAITLDAKLPDNAVIVGGMIDVVTTFTSSGDSATIAISVEGANDIVTAVAISDGGNPWDAGQQDVIPDFTAANVVKLSALRTVTLTIAVEAVTAGRLTGVLLYFVSK